MTSPAFADIGCASPKAMICRAVSSSLIAALALKRDAAHAHELVQEYAVSASLPRFGMTVNGYASLATCAVY